jgi:hypothetical protein
METRQKLRLILGSSSLFLLMACSSSFRSSDPYPGVDVPTPEFSEEYADYPALPWEAEATTEEKSESLKVPTTQQRWTNFLYSHIDTEAPNLLEGASDMNKFCPRYDELSRPEKVMFWGKLIAEMTRYESGFDPQARTIEPNRVDELQGTQLYSEGLLQLSYQDTKWMPKCRFDWNVDRYLANDDPRKSIFNPYLNLECGVYILNRQQRDGGPIVRADSAYWAVLKSSFKSNKISQISTATKELSFCKKTATAPKVTSTL